MIKKITFYLLERPKLTKRLNYLFGALTVAFGITTTNVITIYTPVKAIIRSILFCICFIATRFLDAIIAGHEITK